MTMRTLARIGMGFALLAAGSWASLRAEDAAPPEKGTVRITILKPDAKPLTDSAVWLWPVGRDLDFKPELKNPFDARTDANGTVEFKFLSCVAAFRVIVPGVGFGLTGNVEILPDQTAQAALALQQTKQNLYQRTRATALLLPIRLPVGASKRTQNLPCQLIKQTHTLLLRMLLSKIFQR